jgi:hypothetical protein
MYVYFPGYGVNILITFIGSYDYYVSLHLVLKVCPVSNTYFLLHLYRLIYICRIFYTDLYFVSFVCFCVNNFNGTGCFENSFTLLTTYFWYPRDRYFDLTIVLFSAKKILSCYLKKDH